MLECYRTFPSAIAGCEWMIDDHSFGGKHLPREVLIRVGNAGWGQKVHRVFLGALLAAAMASMAGCGGAPELPPAPPASSLPSAEYRIGPGDSLNIFVWRNPELTVTVPVRPDGRFSIPLVEDVVAIGKTPTALAREYGQRLAKIHQGAAGHGHRREFRRSDPRPGAYYRRGCPAAFAAVSRRYDGARCDDRRRRSYQIRRRK